MKEWLKNGDESNFYLEDRLEAYDFPLEVWLNKSNYFLPIQEGERSRIILNFGE